MARRGRAWFGGLATRRGGVDAIDETTRRVRIVPLECVSRHCRACDEGSAYVVLLRQKKAVQEDGWTGIENSNLERSATAKETSYRPGYKSPHVIGIRVQKNGSRSRELIKAIGCLSFLSEEGEGSMGLIRELRPCRFRTLLR